MPVLNSTKIRERVTWAIGPLLAALLILTSIVGNSGPGFFLFALVAGGLLGIAMPLMQLFIRRARAFAGRPIATALVALILVFLVLAAISGAILFNQW